MFRLSKQVKLFSQTRKYWTPPKSLNEHKVLIPYPLVCRLESIHQNLLLLSEQTQPINYSSSRTICDEVIKLNESIEQIKKFNKVY